MKILHRLGYNRVTVDGTDLTVGGTKELTMTGDNANVYELLHELAPQGEMKIDVKLLAGSGQPYTKLSMTVADMDNTKAVLAGIAINPATPAVKTALMTVTAKNATTNKSTVGVTISA